MLGTYLGLGIWWAGIFLFARPTYGRLRASSLEYNMKTYPTLYPRNEHGIKHWEREDGAINKAGGAILAIIWPLVIPGIWFAKWMDSTKYRSQTELRIEQEKLQSRIRELERENGYY